MFASRQTGRQISVCASKRKLDTSETESTQTRNLRYNSTQSLQTTVWLVEKQRQCAAVTAIFYARFAAAAAEGAKEKPRLDASIEDNPRLRRAAPPRATSVGQFANSRRSAKIYDAPEIFHYRFSWTSRCTAHTCTVDRNICPHVPHNTSRVCATRVRASSRDLNSGHVLVINAITYKLWRELEPYGDLYRGFRFLPSSILPLLRSSLTPCLFLFPGITEARWPAAG